MNFLGIYQYIFMNTATDMSFAPNGCDSFYALVPVPNLISKNISWNMRQIIFKLLL